MVSSNPSSAIAVRSTARSTDRTVYGPHDCSSTIALPRASKVGALELDQERTNRLIRLAVHLSNDE
eukprot:4970335-Pleurochrysis_carterae.AAC.9